MCHDLARCPQCKSPFTYIYCHRLLDGTVVDFPVEETITLLKRAKWFEERLKVVSRQLGSGKCLSEFAYLAYDTYVSCICTSATYF